MQKRFAARIAKMKRRTRSSFGDYGETKNIYTLMMGVYIDKNNLVKTVGNI